MFSLLGEGLQPLRSSVMPQIPTPTTKAVNYKIRVNLPLKVFPWGSTH